MPKKHLKRGWRVLDVGGGDAPNRRAHVIVERFLQDVEQHRGGRAVVLDRPSAVADVEALPFANDAFDYVICSHVIEHVDHPEKALRELSRVANTGYIAAPSEIFEILSPLPAHKWVVAYRDETLLMKPRSEKHLMASKELFGGIFWMLYRERDWKRFALNHQFLFAVEFEWKDRIPYRILDADTPFFDYSSIDDVAGLITRTPPEDLGEQLKRWARIYLPLERVKSLNASYHASRRVLHNLRRILAI